VKRKKTKRVELNIEQRQEVAAWIDAHLDELPETVRDFFALHLKYLNGDKDPHRQLDGVVRELRRALGITPSSERRRSGDPLSSLPKEEGPRPRSERERLEQQQVRAVYLGDWHRGLKDRHDGRAERIKGRLAKLAATAEKGQAMAEGEGPLAEEEAYTPLEEIELTDEQRAASAANARVFASHLGMGDGADPALASVNETLMPCGSVTLLEEHKSLPVELREEDDGAELVQTLSDSRVRYDFAVTVTRIEVDVEKKVLVDADGERRVVAASTHELGPPRYTVTWSALATLAMMVAQYALPLNRLATMLSTAGKRFTAGSLGRLLHYVAERFVEVYLELARQLADATNLAGDDTSCRVLDVSAYLCKKPKDAASSTEEDKPPWEPYKTPEAAEASFRRCAQARQERERRREDGDREAKPGPDEEPSLGVLIGRELAFESPRSDGSGPKQALNTTVVSGRTSTNDPRSLIVFYRSHLGGFGNLLASLLKRRRAEARALTVQADLATTNLVPSPELLERFDPRLVGCSAHARRPFALYQHEDPVLCEAMLHLFVGLAIHEQQLDVFGRNRDNVLAVRQHESRKLWEEIRELAELMTYRWSKATKLGTAARYILKHYDKLTAYLDDPLLEPTNNMRERMLRTEKLIEGSSMFRRTLEGRFALDVVRTVLQTAVAANVPVHQYLMAVLRADPDDVRAHPERFTPRAWAAENPAASEDSDSTR